MLLIKSVTRAGESAEVQVAGRKSFPVLSPSVEDHILGLAVRVTVGSHSRFIDCTDSLPFYSRLVCKF